MSHLWAQGQRRRNSSYLQMQMSPSQMFPVQTEAPSTNTFMLLEELDLITTEDAQCLPGEVYKILTQTQGPLPKGNFGLIFVPVSQ